MIDLRLQPEHSIVSFTDSLSDDSRSLSMEHGRNSLPSLLAIDPEIRIYMLIFDRRALYSASKPVFAEFPA